MSDIGGMDMGWCGGPSFGLLWMGIGLSLLVAFAFLLYSLFSREIGHATHPRSAHWPHGPSRNALAILDERYARGEISRDDYLWMRDDLMRRR